MQTTPFIFNLNIFWHKHTIRIRIRMHMLRNLDHLFPRVAIKTELCILVGVDRLVKSWMAPPFYTVVSKIKREEQTNMRRFNSEENSNIMIHKQVFDRIIGGCFDRWETLQIIYSDTFSMQLFMASSIFWSYRSCQDVCV